MRYFNIRSIHNPSGYKPGVYYFVVTYTDRQIQEVKVSRYVRRFETAQYKASKYDAIERSSQLPRVWPEVTRYRELIDSKYAVPNLIERTALQTLPDRWAEPLLKALAPYEGRLVLAPSKKAAADLVAGKYQLKPVAREQGLAEAQAILDAKRYGNKLQNAVTVQDHGDVRQESTGDTYPYIVVGVEKPGGTQWFVQYHGKAVSVRTTEAEQAFLWAALYKHTHPQYAGPVSQDDRGVPSAVQPKGVTMDQLRARYRKRGVPV